jgi:hypothetical protein
VSAHNVVQYTLDDLDMVAEALDEVVSIIDMSSNVIPVGDQHELLSRARGVLNYRRHLLARYLREGS